MAIAAAVLEVFLGTGALGGGLALMLGPLGQLIPLPLSALQGSPFATYFWPGLILFTMLGIVPLAVALLAWRRHPWAPVLTIGVGAALLIWLAVQINIIGYSGHPPLQATYLGLGFVLTGLGLAWFRKQWLASHPDLAAGEDHRDGHHSPAPRPKR